MAVKHKAIFYKKKTRSSKYSLWIIIWLSTQAIQLLRLSSVSAVWADVFLHRFTHLFRNPDAIPVEPITAVLTSNVESATT